MARHYAAFLAQGLQCCTVCIFVYILLLNCASLVGTLWPFHVTLEFSTKHIRLPLFPKDFILTYAYFSSNRKSLTSTKLSGECLEGDHSRPPVGNESEPPFRAIQAIAMNGFSNPREKQARKKCLYSALSRTTEVDVLLGR